MRLSKNSISKVNLSDILRRRRKTLSQFLNEFGIVTYELLVSRCNSMGVVPPSEEKFLAATGGNPPQVSSPSEGVVIVETPEEALPIATPYIPNESTVNTQAMINNYTLTEINGELPRVTSFDNKKRKK